MKWYMVSFLTHREAANCGGELYPAREYKCILNAPSSEVAYADSQSLAALRVAELNKEPGARWTLDGLSDLLMLSASPAPGSELTWSEEEMPPSALMAYVTDKARLRAFAEGKDAADRSGWYVCDIVLVEVHDSGTHGETVLVWANSCLIQAKDADSAYSLALTLADEQQSEPGSHHCDGDTAHFEFKGFHELAPTIDPPGDHATILVDDLLLSREELRSNVHPRARLSVFEWEERQQRSPA